MSSDYEKSAAQAAVDAVEARWRKNNELHQRQMARKRWRNIGAVLALLAIAAFAYAAFVGKGDFTMAAGLKDKALAFLQSRNLLPERLGGGQNVDAFAARLKSVVDSPVRLLKDLPPTDSPKRASAGKTFVVLSSDGQGGFRLFVLSADGKGGLIPARCSPFGEDCRIPWNQFRRECVKPYLIWIGGSSYLCGSKDLRAADKLKASVRQFEK